MLIGASKQPEPSEHRPFHSTTAQSCAILKWGWWKTNVPVGCLYNGMSETPHDTKRGSKLVIDIRHMDYISAGYSTDVLRSIQQKVERRERGGVVRETREVVSRHGGRSCKRCQHIHSSCHDHGDVHAVGIIHDDVLFSFKFPFLAISPLLPPISHLIAFSSLHRVQC